MLRHYAKGNDYWMHTRDYPGGYVFIKYLKEKTVPLEVLIDAANLALVFSKAKKRRKSRFVLHPGKISEKTQGSQGRPGFADPRKKSFGCTGTKDALHDYF
ncbi:hypothetical protein [uncultured Sphaerochaeta sp.]|uniref:hypothetical protein n=1 Tax=uncultured Sphaerochaeta sp. TaxID=886478 RepID=UPI00374A3F86